MIMKKLFLIILLMCLNACTSTWTHQFKDNSNINFDKGFCKSLANSKTPTYICTNPFMCSPDETSLVLTSLSQNLAEFEHCMHKKGYKKN